MGRSHAPRSCSGGGDSIPTYRATRLRIGLRTAAVVIGGTLAGYPLTGAGGLISAVALLGVIGMVLVLLALFVRTYLVGPALFVLAAGYVIVEATNRVGTFSVLAYAAGLVILAEVLLWLGQLPSSTLIDTRVVRAWLGNLGLTVVAGALLGLVALAATSFRIPGALTGTLIGCAAAAMLLAVTWFLAWKRSG